MKAMQLLAQGPIDSAPLKLVDCAVPQPAAGEVLLRVSACAVCRTDLHVIEGDLPAQGLPRIPGHQVVGRVEALGPGVSHFRKGDRIGVAWLRHVCGRCEFCLGGRENLCEASRFTGYHADGGYAEYCCVLEDFAYALPDALSDAQVAPLLCAGIIGYRALQRASLPAAKPTLALYGFGSSAHIVIQIALHRGARVFAVSRDVGHCKLALELGASWAGARADEMPADADSAILFAPAGELVPAALARLKKGGSLAIAGIHLSDVPALNYQQHLFYEKNLVSVTSNTRHDGQELLRVGATIPIRSHVLEYPLAEANRALQDLKADRIRGTALLRF